MKNIFVFLLIIAMVFSLNDQTYLTGFANQLGLTQSQINSNINCFSQIVSEIQDFKATVTTSGLSISDNDIIDWVQQIKFTLMEQCSVFENEVKNYFSQNSLASVFRRALCNNLATYNTQIKQQLVAWASTLNSNQDLQAGKSQAYIYQILFGVVDPSSDPIASFTSTVSGMTVSFNGAASSDPNGHVVSYRWNFGDTRSSSNVVSGASSIASHTYSSSGTYTVTLKVTDNSGKTATTTSNVRINASPNPIFTYVISGTSITFDSGRSYDSDGTITNYAWNFGESGSSSNTASGSTTSASHAYATTGTYSVVLTVTDNDGATISQTQNIKINAPPTASFTRTITGRTVLFDGSSSSDPDGGIANYAWNFGDSGSSSNIASGPSSTARHTYPLAGGAFTVTLVVTDTDGATSTTTQSITILPNSAPTADFTPTLSVSSPTLTYNAGASTDSDGTIVNYRWNFGEPSSSSNTISTSSATTTHTYASTGTYTVTLTVTDNDGATQTVTKSVKVNAAPTSLFASTISARTATFNAGASTDSDGTITNYAWNFGESSSSSNTASGSTSTASHTYSTAGGIFTVTLIVTDNDGATKTSTRSITILPNVAPTASFTYTISGTAISFDASASTDSDGSIATYAWNFGQSSSSSNTASGSSSSASHSYGSYGTYTVTLTVTDNEGTTTTLSKSIKINSPPVASFTQSISGTTITFNAATSTDSDGTIANYAWNFGESSSSSNTASGSTTSASHTYATYGTYTITLTVTDNDGASSTQTNNIRINSPPTSSFTPTIAHRVVTFDAGASTDSDGTITNYAWNFGESSSSSNTASGSTSTASHTYSTAGGTFTVTLTVTDSDGATTTSTQSITIASNSAPTASFTYTISGTTISFDASGSTDSDGSIATYAWNFGQSSSSSNTASSSSSSASHSYGSYGTYTVTLTVTDNEGTTATLSQSIKINASPVASFTQTFSGTTMTFDASASTDSDGSVTNYAWTFGESSSSSNTASGSSSSASHTYATIGTYTITLTVTDSDGATNSITKTLAFNNPPTASFTSSISNRLASFNAGASTDSDGTIATYAWNFGDSSSSSNTASGSTSTASHTYPSAGGTFTVTLTVTDNGGASTSTTQSITIAANVAPTGASFTKVASTSGNQITFTGTATDSDGTIANYAWTFGESGSSSNTASSSSASAIHVYAISGTYSVTLTVMDNDGATATYTNSIIVSTVCGNQLHVIAAWDRQGDYDLVLGLPSGKYIGYWNPTANANTDYGKLIQDSGSMSVPEEQCWESQYTPPSGTYNICVNPFSTSGGLPSTVTVTVIINGVSTVYTKTATVGSQTQSCSTSSTSYITSITYP